MKLVFGTVITATAALAFSAGTVSGRNAPGIPSREIAAPIATPVATPLAFDTHTPRKTTDIPTSVLTEVVEMYCAGCHSDEIKRGNLILEGYDVDEASSHLATSEKMIRKLRLQMMPPPGARRPAGDTLVALVETLERIIDKSAPRNPGTRTFQRLNRAEYERAVRDLLGLKVDAAEFLPLDTYSANFDNIADVQALSVTLMESYLNVAAHVSRAAVGDRNAPVTMTTYRTSPFGSQHPWEYVEGAPYGTRGGIVQMHNFPADGEYQFRLNVGGGVGARLEDVDISIDGVQVALLHYERGIGRNLASADAPSGADYVRSEPIKIKAGQHKVSAAFVRRMEGPYEDLIKPHEWSRASGGTGSAGTTEPTHLLELSITGPTNITGISETDSRRRIFACHPDAAAEQRACAERIVTRFGSSAYRRPLTDRDRTSLMRFYDEGAAKGGFEAGVQHALQAILASPFFIFRFETIPENAMPGTDYRISDFELASRLSFFLWGSIPDDELLKLAEQKKLSDRGTLEKQVKRMLADPRGEALATRFAAQWLRLQDVDKVHPDAFLFPDFDQRIADAMRRETELFFNDLVQRDRSVLEVFTADYTFLNEILANQYGIPNVAGNEFRRVQYPDETRRGVLGHGSILVQTSLGNRTSPVLRGKWVMEVLLGSPPPPPPENVPDLEETENVKDGKQLTTRERMELHRENPTCRSCHQYMDPMGLALDNFDVTAKWRSRENGAALDTRGEMYDGTPVSSPSDLGRALIKRPIPLVRSFTENLMAYALGRRVEDFDQPTVRAIVKAAESKGYRMSSFILGVVQSSAFQTKRVEQAADAGNSGQR